MATISTIGFSAVTRVKQPQPSESRAQQADTGLQQADRNIALPQRTGAGEAPSSFKDKWLQNKSNSGLEVRDRVADLQEALSQAAADHHKVGFRQDSRSQSYVIEIKDREGNLVRQFPLEKVLNLQRKMDELSGMVIDEMT